MSSFDYKDSFEKVADIVAKKLNIDHKTITEQSTLQDLGADSIDTFELILKLQDQFGLEIDDNDADSFTDIARIVEYIHKNRKK